MKSQKPELFSLGIHARELARRVDLYPSGIISYGENAHLGFNPFILDIILKSA